MCSANLKEHRISTPNQIMNLFDLPPELRLQIYDLILVQPHPICINKSWDEPHLLSPMEHSNDSLEVAKVYYGENVFVYYFTNDHFSGPKFNAPILNEFAGCIGALSRAKTAALRRVEIVSFGSESGKMIDELRVGSIPSALEVVVYNAACAMLTIRR